MATDEQFIVVDLNDGTSELVSALDEDILEKACDGEAVVLRVQTQGTSVIEQLNSETGAYETLEE